MTFLRRLGFLLSLIVCSLLPATRCTAGLYYSGETLAELPSQWRGFLLDQRALRRSPSSPPRGAASPARERYLEAAAKLEKTAQTRQLTADESADWVRSTSASASRQGRRRPAPAPSGSTRNHFRHRRESRHRLAAPGRPAIRSAACLEQAVRLAPGKLQKAEEYHLKLVRLRRQEPRGAQGLDNLFDVRFVGENGKYEAGKLAAAEQKKLPAERCDLCATAGPLAPRGRPNALAARGAGECPWRRPKTAAAIMDGCVSNSRCSCRELRNHRQASAAPRPMRWRKDAPPSTAGWSPACSRARPDRC